VVAAQLREKGLEAMAYYLNLFSPETYDAFCRSDRSISGFKQGARTRAQRVRPGDKLVCYVKDLSRWVGILEVVEGPFIDQAPLFTPDDDPFVVRFRVRPLVCLPVDHGIPIKEPEVWNALSFTRGVAPRASTWTAKLRSSLGSLEESDGAFLEELVREQEASPKVYPLPDRRHGKPSPQTTRRTASYVRVPGPADADRESSREAPPEERESIRIQGLLAHIGASMRMDIWIPRADRSRVAGHWPGGPKRLLDRLPLNYDELTLKTIEQIDVLWLKGRAIVRAFEVEHTTAIYSGLLRMADLLALQPNMDIQMHIVAPSTRRSKVFEEIQRPVFSILPRGPLSGRCTFLSYEKVKDLADDPHLRYLSDDVLDAYAEAVTDDSG
jgi:hypothetical protein